MVPYFYLYVPQFIETFEVYNGKKFNEILVTESFSGMTSSSWFD